jgi:hypothetical protein
MRMASAERLESSVLCQSDPDTASGDFWACLVQCYRCCDPSNPFAESDWLFEGSEPQAASVRRRHCSQHILLKSYFNFFATAKTQLSSMYIAQLSKREKMQQQCIAPILSPFVYINTSEHATGARTPVLATCFATSNMCCILQHTRMEHTSQHGQF